MILSHSHKFIFIKTNKTAGTSVEIALSAFSGPDDVLTPLTDPDEKTRRESSGKSAQNYRLPIQRYRVGELRNLIRRKEVGYYNHMSAAEIRRLAGPDIWRDYFKFCFERNPWDRIVSYYYWRFRTEPRPSISEFLGSHMPEILKRRGIQLYTINGTVVVDRICRFENLQNDLDDVGATIGLPASVELPHAKASFRKDRRSYREILTSDERDRIAEMFKDEIALLGYEF